ncbi:MAG: hypothetical protein IAG13_15830 [Deltaproteobacteria bacterium]|nr:hypothetical protein [Nannocystaceae bacterium]
MGTRLRLKKAPDWDPDDSLAMVQWVTNVDPLERRRRLHHTSSATLLTEGNYTDEENARGWGSLATAYYGDMLRTLQAELDTVGSFLFPVYAFGYDWRQGNAKSAERLRSFAADVLRQEDASEVVFVTHSMGGYVVREAVRDESMRNATLGVVHIAQPTGGAPVVYRRCLDGLGIGTARATAGVGAGVVAVADPRRRRPRRGLRTHRDALVVPAVGGAAGRRRRRRMDRGAIQRPRASAARRRHAGVDRRLEPVLVLIEARAGGVPAAAAARRHNDDPRPARAHAAVEGRDDARRRRDRARGARRCRARAMGAPGRARTARRMPGGWAVHQDQAGALVSHRRLPCRAGRWWIAAAMDHQRSGTQRGCAVSVLVRRRSGRRR